MSTANWTRSDTRRFPALPHIRIGKGRIFATLVVIVLVAGLGWLWYRGSSFVKIRRVTVAGLNGPDVPEIRAALERSALTMTTLNLNMAQLDAAVVQYPTVHALTATTEGDHAVLIRVNEQVPVALVTNNGQLVVVDGYGELLPKSTVPHGVLPTLPLASAPSGSQITAAGTLAVLRVLQAAPYRWLAHVQTASSSAAHGVVLQLRKGPEVYFGPDNQMAAKWNALDAVLESSGSQGAQYIDVSDPQRPAAGVNVTTTPTTTNTTATNSGTTAASGTTGQ
jgi:cell division septal protein FtsQ